MSNVDVTNFFVVNVVKVKVDLNVGWSVGLTKMLEELSPIYFIMEVVHDAHELLTHGQLLKLGSFSGHNVVKFILDGLRNLFIDNES